MTQLNVVLNKLPRDLVEFCFFLIVGSTAGYLGFIWFLQIDIINLIFLILLIFNISINFDLNVKTLSNSENNQTFNFLKTLKLDE